MMINLPFLIIGILAIIGLMTMVFRKNIIKIILGLGILESAVNLFLVAIGYRQDGIAPIFTSAPKGIMVLPTVQALTLTSIVIGVATLALLLSFSMVIYKRYKTLNVQNIRKLQG